MRVITGFCKGKRLITPDGKDVRPTSDKVKEAVFSALQFDIEGRRVLDLFAGSGQLGIEALSRGAESATFVDSAISSVKIIKKNIELCGLQDKTKVFNLDYASFCAMSRDTFDIAFLDPPYSEGILPLALKAVLPLMSSFGIIVCEHPSEVELPESIGGFSILKAYSYGKIKVTVYNNGNRKGTIS